MVYYITGLRETGVELPDRSCSQLSVHFELRELSQIGRSDHQQSNPTNIHTS